MHLDNDPRVQIILTVLMLHGVYWVPNSKCHLELILLENPKTIMEGAKRLLSENTLGSPWSSCAVLYEQSLVVILEYMY